MRATAARHAESAESSPSQLARKWLLSFKWLYLPLFLSDLGRQIIERKYDAFVTDSAYENRPSGRWGIGTAVDWYLRRQDVHVALRQRLAIVVDEVTRAVREQRASGAKPVHLVSGPCGLARDVRTVWSGLVAGGEAPDKWLTVTGIDLDASGEVIRTAKRMAEESGTPVNFVKQDLLDSEALAAAFADKPVHAFVSAGLGVWLDRDELLRLLSAIHGVLAPNGLLIVDNMHACRRCRMLADFEMEPHFATDIEFETVLKAAGYRVERKRPTANDVNVVYTARRPVD